MRLYYDHTLYSFPPYTFLWPEDGPQWPKYVVVSTINRIQDSCVLTYPTPSLNLIILCIKFSVHLFASFIKRFKAIWSPRKMLRLDCAVYSKVGVRIRKAANCVLLYNVGRGVMLAKWHYEWQSLAAWIFCTNCSSLVATSKARHTDSRY